MTPSGATPSFPAVVTDARKNIHIAPIYEWRFAMTAP
jgi:hypothetical protein